MQDFHDNALVAFADLCGFKNLIHQGTQARDALDQLYNKAYELAGRHESISALAVSDCVIAWSPQEHFEMLLTYLKELHQHMIQSSRLMRSTIAFGRFEFEVRHNHINLQKGMMLGKAYLDAYAANDQAEIGSITFCNERLPDPMLLAPLYAPFIQRIGDAESNWEFFWSVNEPNKITEFKLLRQKGDQIRFEHLVKIHGGPPMSPL